MAPVALIMALQAQRVGGHTALVDVVEQADDETDHRSRKRSRREEDKTAEIKQLLETQVTALLLC